MSRKKIGIPVDFVERLKILMGEVGYPGRQQVKFANKIGISQGFLSDVVNLKSGPSADLFTGIANNFPAANIRWLLTGEGSPLGKPHETIIDAHPHIVPLGENLATPTDQDIDEYVAVPLVVGKIAAGSGRIVREDVHSFVWVYRQEVGRRTNLVAVQVGPREKSMLPTLTPGCIVIIDRNDKVLTKTGIYAVRTGQDECAVKRVLTADGTVLLCSDNLDYPPFVAPTSDLEQLIVGRVIWSWKSFLR